MALPSWTMSLVFGTVFRPHVADAQETAVEHTTAPLENEVSSYSLASWMFQVPARLRVGLESPLVAFSGRRSPVGMLRG